MLTTTVFSIFFPSSQLTTTDCSVKSPEPPVKASCVRTFYPSTRCKRLRPRPFWLVFSFPHACKHTSARHVRRHKPFRPRSPRLLLERRDLKCCPPAWRTASSRRPPSTVCFNLLPTHGYPFLSVPGKKSAKATDALDGRVEDRVCERAGRWKGGAIGCPAWWAKSIAERRTRAIGRAHASRCERLYKSDRAHYRSSRPRKSMGTHLAAAQGDQRDAAALLV
jgi:hypothetical protein